MKTLQKKTETCSSEQKKRLDSVKHQEWREAQKAVLPIIARLLHGRVKTDKDGQVVMVGGYTKYGAHSEQELGGEALWHYWGKIVETLFDGTCEWDPELSLADQLKEMAEPVIDEAVKEYRSRQKEEERLGIRVGMDVEWLGEDESLSETTTDHHHMMWELICEVADGDAELEAFVQVTGESLTMQEVNERLGLKGDDRDRLLKRLKRRVDKKCYPMGNRRGRKKRLKNSVGFGRFLDNRLVRTQSLEFNV